MNSLEWRVQRTSAWWVAGLVLLTAILTLWGATPDALAQATTIQNLTYGYDNKGNVTTITDTINGNQTFGYDELNRLTSATGPYGSQSYSYDEIGNMLSNPLVGSYSYPVSGASSVRPHAVSTAGSNTYGYDNNGNMTSGAGRTLTYDFENRPTSISSGGVTTTMVYDGDGGRVKKVAGDTTVRYIGKLYECDNATCVKYIFAGSQRIAVKQVSNGLVDYYHQDHLGSSSVVTHGTTGAVEENLAYYAYGATRTNTSGTTPPTDVPYKYTGKELDSSTGLYFYEARYYDATLGRFISADTIVPSARDPQSLNRYSYARNNPLYYTDPTGHRFLGSIGKFFAPLAKAELQVVNFFATYNPVVASGLMTPSQYLQAMIIVANIVEPGAGTAFQLWLAWDHAIAGDKVDFGRAVASAAASYAMSSVDLGIDTETGSYWEQVGKNFADGAIRGGGSALANDLIQGKGDVNSVLRDVGLGALQQGSFSAAKPLFLGGNVTRDYHDVVQHGQEALQTDLSQVTIRMGGILAFVRGNEFQGMTIGNYINVSSGLDTGRVISILGEELAHVTQYRSMGVVGFLIQYGKQAIQARFDHDKIPLEREAAQTRDQVFCQGYPCY